MDVAWQLSSKKPFDRRTTTEVTLDKDKDRMGCMPKKRSFTIGGNGNLTVESGDVVNSKGSNAVGLRPSEHEALGLLISGMTRKEWETKCAENGIPVGTYKPAVSTLKKRHVFEDQDKRYWPRSVDEDKSYVG